MDSNFFDANVKILCIECILILVLLFIAVCYIRSYVTKEIKKITDKNMQNMQELIKSNNNTLLAEIVASVTAATAVHQINMQQHVTHTNSAKSHHDELANTFAKLKDAIKDDLFSTMNNTHACRVALYLLHNGQSSTGGIGFIKVSCVGERILVGSGIKERLINHTNIPINIFDNMMEKLIEHGKYIIMNDPETMATSRGTFISSNKIRYSQAVSIYDTSNNILGFILGEFDHSYSKISGEEEFKALNNIAVKIAPMLSFSEYAEVAANASSSEHE